MGDQGQADGWTFAYDKDLMKIEHYIRYPIMLPWIGTHYGKKYPKTIFVGESPYFPEGSKKHLKADRWYESTQKKLNGKELDYINLRVAPKGRIWSNTERVMADLGIEPPPKGKRIYEYFGYFNFFQRPAEKEGSGITPNEEDCAAANAVLRQNIAILKPKVVIFLSVLAWNSWDKWDMEARPNVHFDFTPHPGSQRWNMRTRNYSIGRSGPLTGSEKFSRLVKAYIMLRKK